MIDKTIIQQHLNILGEIGNDIKINQEIINRIEELKSICGEFLIKILAIGSFSAGKSALMNFLLEEELLTEEQTPETAIATELKYSLVESYEIVDVNKERKYVEKQQIQSVNPNVCLNIRYNLNNNFLKIFEDYVFVDMPGFNSNIEQHNRAILQYVERGNAYLLVIDCEEGGMKASVLEFIEEIRKYDHNLIIVLSKVDKKAEEDVQVIEQQIKAQASYLFGYDVPVVKYSKHDNDTKQGLLDAIHALNSQQIFEQAILPKIKEIYQFFELALEQSIKSLAFDDSALREEIQKREKAKSELEYKLQQERSKLTNRMTSQVLPSIIAEVENALYVHSTELANAAISGSNAFSIRMNSILRPVLLENTKKYTNISFEEFLRDVNLLEILVDKTEEIVYTVTDKMRKVESIFSRKNEGTDNFNKVYKSVTGALAIATTAVAPWLEIIILFLPEILKLLGVGGKQSQVNKVKQSIESEVIPQVIEKLSPAIQESLAEMEDVMIEELEENLRLIISIEEEALQAALNQQDDMQIEHDKKLIQYETTLDLVRDELQKVEKLVTV
ncbi:dynamin family protein [Lysinibacillus varians]|uniref:Dynamin N-terminal domain-containing protein n=1 Tax=Lysinibacillus varians TaxID=1145276 RepID=A0ABY2TIM1_9BACI|nr:dynamin family protein [Lysinibacillus varians]AHN24458.1 hypothetical protein T479_19145 [Lysinibacillus varians]TKI66452.1 hypothetical protein FC752_04195 [Lysinibacillus varians]